MDEPPGHVQPIKGLAFRTPYHLTLSDAAVTLKFNQSHLNRNENVKLNGRHRHAKFESFHLDTKRERTAMFDVSVEPTIYELSLLNTHSKPTKSRHAHVESRHVYQSHNHTNFKTWPNKTN